MTESNPTGTNKSIPQTILQNSSNNKSQPKNQKKNLWGAAALQTSLIVFGITTAILNTIPYLEFAKNMWFSAASKTDISSFQTIASILWLISGLSIWAGLQLLEMLPSIKIPVSKGLQNQIRFVGYGLDIALLNSVYPFFQIPPDIENILLAFFALFAVEFAVWLYDRLSPAARN